MSQIEDGDVRRHAVVRIADEIVVDLMASACGVTYDDAIVQGIEDVDIPLAGKQLLIRMKNTLRDSDRMDVRFLQWRIEDDNT